jgi:hypothetical protein
MLSASEYAPGEWDGNRRSRKLWKGARPTFFSFRARARPYQHLGYIMQAKFLLSLLIGISLSILGMNYPSLVFCFFSQEGSYSDKLTCIVSQVHGSLTLDDLERLVPCVLQQNCTSCRQTAGCAWCPSARSYWNCMCPIQYYMMSVEI